jgi:hypothetical protein
MGRSSLFASLPTNRGYTARPEPGKSPHTILNRPTFKAMRRPLLFLLIILVLLVGALVFLSNQAREVPTKTIEADVVQGGNAQ